MLFHTCSACAISVATLLLLCALQASRLAEVIIAKMKRCIFFIVCFIRCKVQSFYAFIVYGLPVNDSRPLPVVPQQIFTTKAHIFAQPLFLFPATIKQ